MNMGSFGNISLSLMMCLFAFSSIIGWALYGRLCAQYIFGKIGVKIFTLLYPICCILGAVFDSDLVWRLAAVCNSVMLCANLTAVLLLKEKFEPYLKRGQRIENKRNSKNITA